MEAYFEISILVSGRRAEVIIAELADHGYYAFEETEEILKAYILNDDFDQDILEKILGPGEKYIVKEIHQQNWNAQWESEFRPVVIDDYVSIRADFHPPANDVKYDLVITPKMSFGTGHHATTALMISMMKKLDFRDKSVLDFGTGTGILAILAEKLGSTNVEAIDNDDWSIENARENVLSNNCIQVCVLKSNRVNWESSTHSKDIILANINYGILSDSVGDISRSCGPGSDVVLSGFLISDLGNLARTYQNGGFAVIQSETRGDWAAVHLKFL